MKQRGWRLTILALLFLGLGLVIVPTILAEECHIEEIDPPEVTSVEVTLIASPASGPAPLSVSFTCTARAIVHYADEVCVSKTEEGSVETRTPLYKYKALQPECPAATTLRESGSYTFTATAEYGGVTGSATATVEVNCRLYQLAYGEAQRAEAIAQQEVDRAQAEVDRLKGEVKEVYKEAWRLGYACENCKLTIQPWLQGKLCGPVCKEADEWNTKWEEKVRELNEAKRNLRQKKRELKEAKRRTKEALKAWQRCKGTD